MPPTARLNSLLGIGSRVSGLDGREFGLDPYSRTNFADRTKARACFKLLSAAAMPILAGLVHRSAG